jgi:Uma2 family endonuclease
MNILPKRKYTTDEFLDWAIDRPSGPRYELLNGELVEMAPERAGHAYTKMYLVGVLRAAAKGIGADVLPDGMSVKVDGGSVFEPDAIVRLGAKLPADQTYVVDPIILCEVLSPSTSRVDTGEKLKGYFTISTVRHYLTIDVKARTITHYHYQDDEIVGDIVSTGELLLSPPGLLLPVAAVFGGTGED